MTKYYTFEIVIEKEPEDPGYFAYCPVLPGCITCGDTVEETRSHMMEAMTVYLESMIAHGDPIPKPESRILVENMQVEVDMEIAV